MSERDRLLDAMAPSLMNRSGATVAKHYTLDHQTGSGRTAIRKMVRLTSGESYSETALNAAIRRRAAKARAERAGREAAA